MSDNQSHVKKVSEQAMASLLERAKRMQLSSVSVSAATVERFNQQHGLDSNIAAGNQKKLKTSPFNMGAAAAGGGGAAGGVGAGAGGGSAGGMTQRPMATLRKPRKFDAEPSPPPPSPRELCKIGELREEYNQIDKQIDKMLQDATSLNHDMLYFSKYQLDLSLVQEIELEATMRSINTLFGALNAECERNELKDIMNRCSSALERAKDRLDTELKPEMPLDSEKQQPLSIEAPADIMLEQLEEDYELDKTLENLSPPKAIAEKSTK